MSYGALPGGRTLFLDLDGVMADFDGAFWSTFGFDHRSVPDKLMWKAINEHGSYFRDLPPCAGAIDFFHAIRFSEHPVILTACPPSNFEAVAEQKRGWVAEHLGDVPVIFAPGGKTKGLYLNRPGDILIDDFQRNIERWNAAGGVGILHTGDFGATYRNLIGALWPTSQPASVTSRAPSVGPRTTSPATTTATASASDASTTNPLMELIGAIAALPLPTGQVRLRD